MCLHAFFSTLYLVYEAMFCVIIEDRVHIIFLGKTVRGKGDYLHADRKYSLFCDRCIHLSMSVPYTHCMLLFTQHRAVARIQPPRGDLQWGLCSIFVSENFLCLVTNVFLQSSVHVNCESTRLKSLTECRLLLYLFKLVHYYIMHCAVYLSRSCVNGIIGYIQ